MALKKSKGGTSAGAKTWEGGRNQLPPPAPTGQVWTKVGVTGGGGGSMSSFATKFIWSLGDDPKSKQKTTTKKPAANEKEKPKKAVAAAAAASKPTAPPGTSGAKGGSAAAPATSAEKAADTFTKQTAAAAAAPQETLKKFKEQYSGLTSNITKEFLGKDIRTAGVNAILSSLHARGVTGKEVPSAIETYLTTSPKYQEFIKSDQQRANEYLYGSMGRDKEGQLTNTFSSVLASNAQLQGMYDLKEGQQMSISDINHLQGVDLQNVVNAGLKKVANIQATSNLMSLIGYAFG